MKHVFVFTRVNLQMIKEDGAQRENFLPKYYEQSYCCIYTTSIRNA